MKYDRIDRKYSLSGKSYISEQNGFSKLYKRKCLLTKTGRVEYKVRNRKSADSVSGNSY